MLQFPDETDWQPLLEEELASEYFLGIKKQHEEAINSGLVIYPETKNIFYAFQKTSFRDTQVIILGQDPYHKEGQAMGLSFSVPDGEKVPPSLRNIFKELSQDLSIKKPETGNLERWAEQGVFLLNSVLTVEANSPKSHAKWGWEQFTDSVIELLSRQKDQLVFMLWGNEAKRKKSLIDSEKHLILEAAHPSPLARNKFLGCHHFSSCNTYLKKKSGKPIYW